MARSACWPVLATAVIGSIASCAPGVPAPAPTPAQPAVTASQPVASGPSAIPTPSASQVASAAPSTSAPPPRRRNFVPGTVACGDKLCKAGQEVCCLFSGEGSCAERKPFGKGTMLEQKLEPQFQACAASTKSQYSLSDLAYCDDYSVRHGSG